MCVDASSLCFSIVIVTKIDSILTSVLSQIVATDEGSSSTKAQLVP